MGENSAIEWTDHTFNPWTGCTKISPGCANCYAEGWAKRSGLVEWGPNGTRRITSASNWQQPEKWDRQAAAAGRRAQVFCASLADVFEDTPGHDGMVGRTYLWSLIRRTSNLDWLLLTKRPENIAGMFPFGDAPPRNVMFGMTAENQEWFLRRWHHMRPLRADGWRTFVSAEPLLGPLSLDLADPPDWVICGGESGPKARPMHPDWAHSLRDQCAVAGIPFMFKQWGEWLPITTDNHGDGLIFYPEDGGPCGRLEGKTATSITENGQEFARVGKKAAGRLLDGLVHDQFPRW